MSAHLLDAFFGIALGLVLLFGAGPLSETLERERSARLAELEAGAGEVFFEEKRALESYPLRPVRAFRLLGAALVIMSLAFALPRFA